MAKARSVFSCSSCGTNAATWVGRCPGCGEWNTLVEELELPASEAPVGKLDTPVPIGDVDTSEVEHRSTGSKELDRVLSGGLVPGSVTLLGGEPGIGKSTLLMQILAAMSRDGARTLYVTAEESKQQVRLRAERLGSIHDELWLTAETSVSNVVRHIDDVKPDIVVVDSIQSVHNPALSSAPGSVAQVRESAHRLVRVAKERGISIVLVGHVTKDGGLAGPRVLEHVVDTVLEFSGDRHHALRLLRATKHRYGATAELGLFEMTEGGLKGVPDPSGLFLSDRVTGIAGSAVVSTVEGHRPLLVEIQALVTPSTSARRSAQGVDGGRLNMLLAVLESRAELSFSQFDVFVSAVGGVQITEPGADIAIVLALVSAFTGKPLPAELVACGEVGLAGEVRLVGHVERRLSEAARLGLHRAIIPAASPEPPPQVTALRATTVSDAIRAAGLVTSH
jgi:DNA repair protein RadA/Sms